MRIFPLAIVALACGLAAQPASAMPITLKITYEGMPATAENEISSVTFTETGGSFTHPISNLSPELLQLVVMGSLLSDVTFTALNTTRATETSVSWPKADACRTEGRPWL